MSREHHQLENGRHKEADMEQKRVALVVGHEHWGKSRTLRALTDSNSHQRRITINGVEFYVRHMSNDDDPEGYIRFMNGLDPNVTRNLIAPLCPKFKKLENYNSATKVADGVLQNLHGNGYRLFFWVIEHKWADPAIVVTSQEISELRRHGTVELFTVVKAEASVRATAFRTFVSNVVLGLGT
jgi:hypothetical protein